MGDYQPCELEQWFNGHPEVFGGGDQNAPAPGGGGWSQNPELATTRNWQQANPAAFAPGVSVRGDLGNGSDQNPEIATTRNWQQANPAAFTQGGASPYTGVDWNAWLNKSRGLIRNEETQAWRDWQNAGGGPTTPSEYAAQNPELAWTAAWQQANPDAFTAGLTPRQDIAIANAMRANAGLQGGLSPTQDLAIARAMWANDPSIPPALLSYNERPYSAQPSYEPGAGAMVQLPQVPAVMTSPLGGRPGIWRGPMSPPPSAEQQAQAQRELGQIGNWIDQRPVLGGTKAALGAGMQALIPSQDALNMAKQPGGGNLAAMRYGTDVVGTYLRALAQPTLIEEQEVGKAALLHQADDIAAHPDNYDLSRRFDPADAYRTTQIQGVNAGPIRSPDGRLLLPDGPKTDLLLALAELPDAEREQAVDQLKRITWSGFGAQLRALREVYPDGPLGGQKGNWETAIENNSDAWQEALMQTITDPLNFLPESWAEKVFWPMNKASELGFGLAGRGFGKLSEKGDLAALGAKAGRAISSAADKVSFSDLKDVPNPLSRFRGNKRTMLQAGAYDDIIPNIAGKFQRVVDAFGGGGLLGNAIQKKLGIPRVYNDLDESLVNFQKVVKSKAPELIDALRREDAAIREIHDRHPEGGKQAYTEVIAFWKEMQKRLSTGSDIDRAALVALTNDGPAAMRGSQGLITGARNRSRGPYGWIFEPGMIDKWEKQITQHSQLLANTEIVSMDARKVLKEAPPGSLVLVDPPYVSSKPTGGRVAGYPVGKDLSTVQGAVDFINHNVAEADRRGVPMIYTNNYNQDIVDALDKQGFHHKIVEVRSQTVGGHGGKRLEVIAWNDPVASRSIDWRGDYSGVGVREPQPTGLWDLANRAGPGQLPPVDGTSQAVSSGRGRSPSVGASRSEASRRPGDSVASEPNIPPASDAPTSAQGASADFPSSEKGSTALTWSPFRQNSSSELTGDQLAAAPGKLYGNWLKQAQSKPIAGSNNNPDNGKVGPGTFPAGSVLPQGTGVSDRAIASGSNPGGPVTPVSPTQPPTGGTPPSLRDPRQAERDYAAYLTMPTGTLDQQKAKRDFFATKGLDKYYGAPDSESEKTWNVYYRNLPPGAPISELRKDPTVAKFLDSLGGPANQGANPLASPATSSQTYQFVRQYILKWAADHTAYRGDPRYYQQARDENQALLDSAIGQRINPPATDLMAQYAALDRNGRSAFRDQHPELAKLWAAEDDYAKAHPVYAWFYRSDYAKFFGNNPPTKDWKGKATPPANGQQSTVNGGRSASGYSGAPFVPAHRPVGYRGGHAPATASAPEQFFGQLKDMSDPGMRELILSYFMQPLSQRSAFASRNRQLLWWLSQQNPQRLASLEQWARGLIAGQRKAARGTVMTVNKPVFRSMAWR